MYAFQLKDLVLERAKDKVNILDSHKELIDKIEKKIKSGELKSTDEVVTELKRGHEDFRLKFKDEDFKHIAAGLIK